MQSKYQYRKMLLFSAAVFFLTLLITAYAWLRIPMQGLIPLHWNIKGEVDLYGSKIIGLLFAPTMIAVLTAGLTFLPRMEPRLENLQQSQKAYRIVWGGLLIFMAMLHLLTVLSALGVPVEMPKVMAFPLGILFMIIGNYMGKIRSNFMFGIRTPWTLSSEDAWNKTHRLGGRLFFFTGALVFLSGFLRSGSLAFSVLTGALLFSVAALYGYSYRVWRQDEIGEKG